MNSQETVISEGLKLIGVEPEQCRIEGADGIWAAVTDLGVLFVRMESAATFPSVRLTCPILSMPTGELLAFYRKLLDLSARLDGVSIAMDHDTVCINCQNGLDGLTAAAAADLFRRTLKAAEAVSEYLFRKFPSCRLWTP